MTEETDGIRLLRSLLSSEAHQLGHIFKRKILSGMSSLNTTLEFQLIDTLGRGSFATVFSASLGGSSSNNNNNNSSLPASEVVIKMAIQTKIDPGRKHRDGLDHMIHECKILQILQASQRTSRYSNESPSCTVERNNIYLPSLYDPKWQCTNAQLFLPMTPVGVPLMLFASQYNKQSRTKLATKLEKHLKEALKSAHELEYCHRDLRPDNVIYDVKKEVFVIIDWGLGDKAGSDMHEYTGGIAFFHDDIIRYLYNQNTGPLKYVPEFDNASASYVVYAFKLGSRNLSVPWDDFTKRGEALIKGRNKYIIVKK